jgi:UDPglucose--hexose-1-phosphate uridylyltransferase
VSELRRDPITGRWVIVSTDLRKRRSSFHLQPVIPTEDPNCPFCEGHEAMTSGELIARRPYGSPPNGPGWALRVIPSLFPVLRVEGGIERRGEGLFDSMSGVGAHEIIVESPRHLDTLATMGEAAVEQVLLAYRERIADLKRDRRFRYISVFKNFGAASGASFGHSYSQLIALPVVPREVRDEVDGARRHYASKERCIFCDIIRQETHDRRRIVLENADMVALAPYAPRFPFETWILPTRHGSLFEEGSHGEFASLARMIGDLLRRMNRALQSPPFHLLIHTAPLQEDVGDLFHWHIEIIPTLTRVAGFEWATGFHLNPTAPEEAAQVLRDTKVAP